MAPPRQRFKVNGQVLPRHVGGPAVNQHQHTGFTVQADIAVDIHAHTGRFPEHIQCITGRRPDHSLHVHNRPVNFLLQQWLSGHDRYLVQ